MTFLSSKFFLLIKSIFAKYKKSKFFFGFLLLIVYFNFLFFPPSLVLLLLAKSINPSFPLVIMGLIPVATLLMFFWGTVKARGIKKIAGLLFINGGILGIYQVGTGLIFGFGFGGNISQWEEFLVKGLLGLFYLEGFVVVGYDLVIFLRAATKLFFSFFARNEIFYSGKIVFILTVVFAVLFGIFCGILIWMAQIFIFHGRTPFNYLFDPFYVVIYMRELPIPPIGFNGLIVFLFALCGFYPFYVFFRRLSRYKSRGKISNN